MSGQAHPCAARGTEVLRTTADDAVLWRDVFLGNREAVLEMLATFNEDLARLQRAIRRVVIDAEQA